MIFTINLKIKITNDNIFKTWVTKLIYCLKIFLENYYNNCMLIHLPHAFCQLEHCYVVEAIIKRSNDNI